MTEILRYRPTGRAGGRTDHAGGKSEGIVTMDA